MLNNDDKKQQKIQQINKDLIDVPWDEIDSVDFINDEDRDIYSI